MNTVDLWSAATCHPLLVLFSFCCLLVFRSLALEKWDDIRTRRLGNRPPRLPGWLPGNLDGVAYLVYLTSQYRDYQIFDWFKTFPHVRRPTVEFSMGNGRFIFTDEPENIKAVLATQFHDFGKGEVFHRTMEPFLGDSIFATDGEAWHFSRQLLRPQFVKQRIRDLEIFEKHVTKLISLVGGASEGEAVDISSLFYRYTIDTAVEYLMETDLCSLDNAHVEFAEAFDRVQRFHVRSIDHSIATSHRTSILLTKTLLELAYQTRTAQLDPSPE